MQRTQLESPQPHQHMNKVKRTFHKVDPMPLKTDLIVSLTIAKYIESSGEVVEERVVRIPYLAAQHAAYYPLGLG